MLCFSKYKMPFKLFFNLNANCSPANDNFFPILFIFPANLKNRSLN